MSAISTKNSKQMGFTLVEVAVVTPMIVIVVLGILAMLIVLVRSTTVQSVHGGLVNDTRLALGVIEKDVEVSASFFPSTLPGATYKDNYDPGLNGTYTTNGTPAGSTTPSVALNTFFIQGYNQIIDPQDATSTKVIAAFKGTPPCNGSVIGKSFNIATIAVVYFVSGGTLYRRTLPDKTNPTTCGTLLIKQTCPSGSDGNTPACTAKDTALLRNISQFKIDYYLNASDSPAMDAYAASPSPTIDQAKAVVATITVTTSAAGTSITHNTSLRMSRLSN